MTSRADDHIIKARQCLESAHKTITIDLMFDAGRNAYLAAFHAALAFIAYKTGKNIKTHTGVRSEFARLAKDEPRIDRVYTSFLAQSYNLKTVADYGVERQSIISSAEAKAAIQAAERFVDQIEALITPGKQ